MKKVKINQKNDDGNCFQYATKIAINCDEIEKDPQRILNIKPFINNSNWKGINYPSNIEDWKRFEMNNPTFALNVFTLKKKKYALLIFRKLIQIVKNKLTIPNLEREGWHYLAVKNYLLY